MLPVNKSKFLELAAIVANIYDICFQFFCKGVIGDSSRTVENVLKECEDLAITLSIKVETKLPQSFLTLILLFGGVASSPQLLIFFQQIFKACQKV